MNIEKDRVVTIHYNVKDDFGKQVDTSRDVEPLSFIQGTQAILPVLESHLEGKRKGDCIEVRLPSEQAYGPRYEELVEVVKRHQFEEDQKLEVGMEFAFEDESGQLHSVRIVKVDQDDITIDGNHPFAGMDLNFDIEVLDVREATPEELDHGHVHGIGGHHH